MNHPNLINYITHYEDVCFVDCETQHTILRHKKQFSNLILAPANANTILGFVNMIHSERVTIVLPNGTKLNISDALYSARSKGNLISFKGIYINEYYIETMNEVNEKYYMTSIIFE